MSRARATLLLFAVTATLLAAGALSRPALGQADTGRGGGGPFVQVLPPRASSTEEPTKRYDCGNPTPDEQRILELINRARSTPSAEGDRLGIDISEGLPAEESSQLGPKTPLAMNAILLETARAHS